MNNTLTIETVVNGHPLALNIHLPEGAIPRAPWPPPQMAAPQVEDGALDEEGRLLLRAIRQDEYDQECRLWWRSMLAHLRARGLSHYLRTDLGTIHLDIADDDPVWAGVESYGRGYLALGEIQMRKEGSKVFVGSAVVRPSPQIENWPRLALSLGFAKLAEG